MLRRLEEPVRRAGPLGRFHREVEFRSLGGWRVLLGSSHIGLTEDGHHVDTAGLYGLSIAGFEQAKELYRTFHVKRCRQFVAARRCSSSAGRTSVKRMKRGLGT